MLSPKKKYFWTEFAKDEKSLSNHVFCYDLCEAKLWVTEWFLKTKHSYCLVEKLRWSVCSKSEFSVLVRTLARTVE